MIHEHDESVGEYMIVVGVVGVMGGGEGHGQWRGSWAVERVMGGKVMGGGEGHGWWRGS